MFKVFERSFARENSLKAKTKTPVPFSSCSLGGTPPAVLS